MSWLETLRKKQEERKSAREEVKKTRGDKVELRRDYKLDKIEAQEEKSYAVAAKRKWLVFMIVAAIAAYLIIFKGGFGGGGGSGILESIKGFF